MIKTQDMFLNDETLNQQTGTFAPRVEKPWLNQEAAYVYNKATKTYFYIEI